MKKLITLVLLLPIFGFSNLDSSESKNYWKYHERIDEAEKLICDEQFEEALSIFREVFSSYDFVFLKDYKTAAQIAFYLGETKHAYDIIRNGIEAGWELKSIKKNEFLSEFTKEPEWKLIEEEYPDLRKKYFSRLDEITRGNVHEMFKDDQKMAFGTLFRIGEKAQNKYLTNKFAPHSENQYQKFLKIIDTQGYPGEQLIGNNYWMSTILSHHNSITTEYVKNDTLYSSIKPKLLKAIEKGEMSPYEFALIDDWYIAVSSNRKQTGYGFLNSPLKSTLLETDQLRQNVGLRSVEQRNKLVEIEKKTGMNFYLPDWISGEIKIE
ncbi:hypothetical protein [Sediminitomix flava]|uniref:Uncharacterized protein n=1 Tax=Sediminitomix flava TaxID=379075 RepID=A0A315ZEA4_SEDFL|nr:hypothetical protein [Sediminitomix flava]PWJ43861.1 hypothetical protein BC781_101207 [Sediminitomix flava]